MGEIASTLERGVHSIGTYLESAIGELELTQGEANILAQLGRRGPLSIATLHHEFGHKRSTLTNILDRLEARKLVRRELNRKDRRSLTIHLTAPGRRTARRVTKALDTLEEQLNARVGPGDVDGVDRVVAALAEISRPTNLPTTPSRRSVHAS
jgi:DNA-binding MarR family transcriptional regulator